MTARRAASALPGHELRFLTVPFGTYTRIQAISHARHVATVVAALLVVAMTLDLAPRVERILIQAPNQSAIGQTLHIIWYIVLRVADLIGTLLPLGAFLGIFWSEVTLTQTRERLVVWNGGRTPLQTLMPIAIIGVVCGLFQVVALTWLRPAAVAYQIEHGIGSYGGRFDRRLQAHTTWITLDNHLIRARIDYRNSRLLDVDIYEISAAGRMTSRIQARSAVPSEVAGQWRFIDGSRWIAPSPTDATASIGEAKWFTEEVLPLPLAPLWLANLGIEARFLPQASLEAIVALGDTISNGPAYSTWKHARMAQALLPFGMMGLASALAMSLIAFRTTLLSVITIGLAGYFLHVATHSIIWLGEFAYVGPVLAGWLIPIATIVATFVLLFRLAPAVPPNDRRPGSLHPTES
jgi:lipopolysaccharide export LptBFGC system permease protein LptF